MIKKIILALIFSTSAFAIFVPHKESHDIEPPWFTGPLLAPSPRTVPAGHINVEPYIYATVNTGNYGPNWKAKGSKTFSNNIFQPSIQIGLLSWLDFQLNPTVIYNYTQGAGKWSFGDMPLGFDIQLAAWGQLSQSMYGLKLILVETIPIGKYQNLKVAKQGTDIGGKGSWQTNIGLAWGSLYYLGNDRFFNYRLTCAYNLPAPTDVKNLNAYGGALGTKGTVYPAQNFVLDWAFEYTLTRNWSIALDAVGNWAGKARFKGTATATQTAPPSAQFSLAPAIEYNFNSDIGLIAGCWFTVAGRNATQFASAVIAFNYYH